MKDEGRSEELQSYVGDALAGKKPFNISGNNSKSFSDILVLCHTSPQNSSLLRGLAHV